MKSAFQSLYSHKILVSFDGISFETTLEELRMARVCDLPIAPDKVQDPSSGRGYTPAVILLKFSDGRMAFVSSSVTNVVQNTDGVVVNTKADIEYRFSRVV